MVGGFSPPSATVTDGKIASAGARVRMRKVGFLKISRPRPRNLERFFLRLNNFPWAGIISLFYCG